MRTVRTASKNIAKVSLLMALVAALLLTACVPLPADSGITVKDPFARPSPMKGGTGGAFMEITNNGEADRLVSAQSPVAGTVEIHETVNDNGVMRMVPQPDGFELPANETLILKPGGKHIMLMQLVAPLEGGQEIEITLNFEKHASIQLQVPIRMME
jgi:periplasmic copper chaperone A